MEIVPLNNQALQFKYAIDRLCGEANEAARIAPSLFEAEELKLVKRELARLMEAVELKILPAYKRQYPLDLKNKP